MKTDIVDKKMNNLLLQLNTKQIIIFGVGDFGEKSIHLLREVGYEVTEIWDNNENKQGKNLMGIPVCSPRNCKDIVIIISVFNHIREIENQLLELGYLKKDILKYGDLDIFNILLREKEEKEIECLNPNTIQFPITYKCNFNCVMCGMHELVYKEHMSLEQMERVIIDALYLNVKTIGINGGEPFLRNDLCEYIKTIIHLVPNIKQFNIISNGFFTDKIIRDLLEIKKICEGKVYLNLSISIDGIGKVQDQHRGRNDAFYNAQKTIEIIKQNISKYVDNLDVICTVTKNNIWRINEVVVWAEKMGINVNYNIASINKRINNYKKADDFLLQNDELTKYMAAEFFYGQYLQTQRESYFAIYLYLLTGKRYALCPYHKNEWTTILPEGEIAFCPTRSNSLGNGLEMSPTQILQEGKEYIEQIKEKYCESCSHYMYWLSSAGLRFLYEDRIKNSNMRYIGADYDN